MSVGVWRGLLISCWDMAHRQRETEIIGLCQCCPWGQHLFVSSAWKCGHFYIMHHGRSAERYFGKTFGLWSRAEIKMDFLPFWKGHFFFKQVEFQILHQFSLGINYYTIQHLKAPADQVALLNSSKPACTPQATINQLAPPISNKPACTSACKLCGWWQYFHCWLQCI